MAKQLESNPSQLVSSHFKEAIKSYSTFDGSLRLENIYVAHVDTEAGEACMRTQYTYDGTSTRVEKTKESLAAWDAAWDI